MEDNRLVAAAASGDQEAFTVLVERYRRYIYTIAFKVVLDEDDALDIGGILIGWEFLHRLPPNVQAQRRDLSASAGRNCSTNLVMCLL